MIALFLIGKTSVFYFLGSHRQVLLSQDPQVCTAIFLLCHSSRVARHDREINKTPILQKLVHNIVYNYIS